jgi:hypothetical protein
MLASADTRRFTTILLYDYRRIHFYFLEFDMPDATPFLDDLLIRKRGAYGPWGLYHLDSGNWAIVWEACLEEEKACESILYESCLWFNVEPARDGRPANPKYPSQQAALVEIVRHLVSSLEELHGSQRRPLYQTYLSWAKADLMVPLLDWPMSASYPHDMPHAPAPWAIAPTEPRAESTEYGNPMSVSLEAVTAPTATAPAETPAEPEKTPPAPAQAVPAAKKPWEESTERGKGVNFQPDELLHAKMSWVCDNVPRMSRLRILRDGAMTECDRLIAIHYKD